MLVALLWFAVHEKVNAQGWYIRGSIGYAIPQAGQVVDGTGTPYNGTINNTTGITGALTSYNFDRSTFTGGSHLVLGVGYMFNEHVGLDLSASFGLSNQQQTFNDNNVVLDSIPSNVQVLQHAQTPVMLMPALVIQSSGEKVQLYTRAGLAIPLRTQIQQDQLITNLPGYGAVETDDYSFKVTNYFSMGITAALGVQYKLNDHSLAYFEASLLSLSVFIKEADLTSVSVNGQGNYLSQVPVNNRNTYYSNNFTSTANDQSHQPTFSQPFSNVMFSIGIKGILSHPEPTVKNGKGHNSKRYDEEDHINDIRGL